MCEQNTNKRHKWADVLIAIAEGREVQFKMANDVSWTDADVWQGDMCFSSNGSNTQWRVKPKIVRKWLYAYKELGFKALVTIHYYLSDEDFMNSNSFAKFEWFQRLDNSCVEMEES